MLEKRLLNTFREFLPANRTPLLEEAIYTLCLYVENENRHVVLGENVLGGSSLFLNEKSEKTHATLVVNQTKSKNGKTTTYPESSLLQLNPDGHIILEAP